MPENAVVKTWTPKKTFVPRQPDVNRETREDRQKKERSIARMSARRDAIEFLQQQGQKYTLEQLFEVAEKLYDWANK